jgi:hypothetical protein
MPYALKVFSNGRFGIRTGNFPLRTPPAALAEEQSVKEKAHQILVGFF